MPLVPNQSFSQPTKALFAPLASGGGGGGGAGPNLLVSTLGVNPTGAINMFTDNSFDTPTVNFFTNTSNTTNMGLGIVYGANETTSGSNAGVALGLYSNDVGNTYGALTCYQVQLCDSIGNLAAVLQAGPTPGSAYISSIFVSSLNGAAPGGGGGSVPPNLAISTLTLSDQPTALGGTLIFQSVDPNLYTIGVADSNAISKGQIQIGTVGGRDQVYTTVAQIDQLFNSTINGATGIISLNPAGADSIRLGGVGPPGDITIAPTGGGTVNLNATTNIPGSANISSLTVSSINGAAPGGGGNGGAIGVQTIPDPGIIEFLCDAIGGNGNPTALNPPLSISTLLGHTYTYTADATIQASPNQDGTAMCQLQFGNNSRFYGQPFFTSTIQGNVNLISLNWRFIGSGGGNSVYAYNWAPLAGAASTSITLTKQSLTDYGIIL